VRSMSWCRPWVSMPGSPSPRCHGSAPAWTRQSVRSAAARSGTPASPTSTSTRPTLHVREARLGQVVSKAVVVATGITATGGREVLGLAVGDSEEETFWRAFLTDLRGRGLSGVRLVISDQHAGLVAALRRCLQGTAHQRCRVHYARNLLALIPKSHKDMVAAVSARSSLNPTGMRSSRRGRESATSWSRPSPRSAR
jgi:transposase-like protein